MGDCRKKGILIWSYIKYSPLKSFANAKVSLSELKDCDVVEIRESQQNNNY